MELALWGMLLCVACAAILLLNLRPVRSALFLLLAWAVLGTQATLAMCALGMAWGFLRSRP